MHRYLHTSEHPSLLACPHPPGKTQKKGEHKFFGFIRDAKSLLLDFKTALALHLHMLFVHRGMMRDFLDDFVPCRDEHGVEIHAWMDWHLVPGRGGKGSKKLCNAELKP